MMCICFYILLQVIPVLFTVQVAVKYEVLFIVIKEIKSGKKKNVVLE